jgi:hypothetical protein
MNFPSGKRMLLGASAFLSVASFGVAAYPRIIAWADTANGNLIAEQRAATCASAVNRVELGQSFKLNPGQYVCHRDGSTGQIGNDRKAFHIKNGSPERIQAILTQRGFN